MIRITGGLSTYLSMYASYSPEQMLTSACTDFWGPASNFGIPIAAVADMSKDPEL